MSPPLEPIESSYETNSSVNKSGIPPFIGDEVDFVDNNMVNTNEPYQLIENNGLSYA